MKGYQYNLWCKMIRNIDLVLAKVLSSPDLVDRFLDSSSDGLVLLSRGPNFPRPGDQLSLDRAFT